MSFQLSVNKRCLSAPDNKGSNLKKNGISDVVTASSILRENPYEEVDENDNYYYYYYYYYYE